MKKNRYLLCLLLCGVLFYYGIPNLAPYNEGIAGIFSVSWLLLALMVVAGNLTALLYVPNGQHKATRKARQLHRKRKLRYYN